MQKITYQLFYVVPFKRDGFYYFTISFMTKLYYIYLLVIYLTSFFVKLINYRELQGNAILSLSIHPGGRRLLVHCRSLSTPVIMIDLKLHTIMQTFMGSQSFKNRVNSCITPCGTYVISSSQDGAVYVWNADTGQQVNQKNK